MLCWIRKQTPIIARIVMVLVWAVMFAPAAQALAAQAVIPGFKTTFTTAPANTALPALRSVTQGAMVGAPVDNLLTIQQTQAKAILEWDSFNIGADAAVHFDQKGNSSWAALNRIYDQNPSQIFGKLTADGQIYLVNTNGILFGAGSRVNVHSLVATSLGLTNDNFLKDMLQFSGDDTRGDIINRGTITTDFNGSVFLVGPNVGNEGTINAPYGNIGLAAITSGTVSIDSSDHMDWTDTTVSDRSGLSANALGASLISDMGMVGMCGRIVNQEGLVRSITALKKSGRIELAASDLIHTGTRSQTICPIDTATDTADTSFGTNPVVLLCGLNDGYAGSIWHQGTILAPSGEVDLRAVDRVLLDTGSTIDVSGIWQNKSAGANLLSAQLNSIELRDDTEQQDGILKGETVSFSALTGTAIGDTSGTLSTRLITAVDASTDGGTIKIDVASSAGDVIAKSGSSLLFSGGGTRYGRGGFETTKLVSGNKVYDIGDAKEGLVYDAILNNQSRTSTRYGVTDTYTGIYYGGANKLNDYTSGYVVGDSAGKLILNTPRLVLDGTLDGAALAGVYQTDTSEPLNKSGNQASEGHVESAGGTLQIGVGYQASNDLSQVDARINAVSVVASATPLDKDFSLDTVLSDERAQECTISAETLNNAGLSALKLYANTRIGVETGADVALKAGSILAMQARQIDVEGTITVPSGTVDLTLLENKTNLADTTLPQRITIAGTVDVSGRQVDNRATYNSGQALAAVNHLNGGSILLMDETSQGNSAGVAITAGGRVDVSGGHAIDATGVVTGGDAGEVTIQGQNISLDGVMMGTALTGNNGGGITLRTQNLYVGNNPSTGQSWGLILGEHRLDNTGFTRIGLEGVADLEIEDGITLRPSYVKRIDPAFAIGTATAVTDYVDTQADTTTGLAQQKLYLTDRDSLGASALTILAGKGSRYIRPYAQQLDDTTTVLNLPAHSAIEVGPKGAATLKAAGVNIAGRITAPAGTITAKADAIGLNVESSAELDVHGYNRPDAKVLVKGLPRGYTPLDGGTVTLTAAGDLTIANGAVVDVSGADVTDAITLNTDGTLSRVSNASSAGSLTLEYSGNLTVSGTLKGKSYLDGYTGGNLKIARTNDTQELCLTTDILARYLSGGFDSLALSSPKGIAFTDNGSGELAVGRNLILDAPVIAGSGSADQHIELNAAHIALRGEYFTTGRTVKAGGSTLVLDADWIDLDGSVLLDGFGTARFTALHDLTLTGQLCTDTVNANNSRYIGLLSAPGDLILTAGRIYPTTQSSFTLSTVGTLATRSSGLSAAQDGPILSAGGRLTLTAAVIDHGGDLYAPLGNITLDSSTRTTLEHGSILSVAGQADVAYGALSETAWSVTDPATGTTTTVSAAPSKSITITSDDVTVVNKGAVIDASDGGTIFGYTFLAGTHGTTSPLIGTYILVPGVVRNGLSVKVNGGNGLAAGTYSVVYVSGADDANAALAFLPGALVLTDLGVSKAAGSSVQSSDGHAVMSGSFTFAGLSRSTAVKHLFSVRPASDLLAGYDVEQISAGEGGAISISGRTAVVGGAVKARALSGYSSGSLSLSALKTEVIATDVAAEDIIDAEGEIKAEYKDTCIVSSEALRDSQIGQIQIGKSGTTKTVTVEQGAEISGANVALSADEKIDIQSGSTVSATGTVSLLTPTGEIDVAQDAGVHAGNGLTLNALVIKNNGSFTADDGSLTLAADHVYIASEGTANTHADGLNLAVGSGGMLTGFTGFDTITLSGKADLIFIGDVDLGADKKLVIDTPRIACASAATDSGTISVRSSAVALMNSGSISATDTRLDSSARLSISGDSVQIGRGSILLDGFGDVSISAASDLTFIGQGGLTMDGGAGHALTLTAGQITASGARVAGSAYTSDLGYYEAANFALDAGERALNILSSGIDTAGLRTPAIPGGTLSLSAQSIQDVGTINLPSGALTLSARDTITVASGARINAAGTAATAAGNVSLHAENGNVAVQSGATIDIAAGAQGDAGSLAISSVKGAVSLEGTLAAASRGGRGAALSIDAATVDLDAVAAEAAAGDLDGTFIIRARTGDLSLTDKASITARDIELTADRGHVTIAGTLDAAGEAGGYVTIEAGKDLTLSGTIDASATASGEEGGEVHLSAGANDSSGTLGMSGGIKVAGRGSGSGGSVYLRAPRTSDNRDVRMDLAGGTVTGASRVVAEAFEAYTSSTSRDFIYNDTIAFTGNVETLGARLFGTQGLNLRGGDLRVLAGIEIDSDADLTLKTDWDLNAWRFGDANDPIMLTLKAGGDLILNGNIADHTAEDPESLAIKQPLGSAGITLKAGRDIRIGSHVVYTENGELNLEAGRDIVASSGTNPGYMINDDDNMKYNVATFDGDIRARAGRDILLAAYDKTSGETTGGAIQSAAGDIDLKTGRNLVLGYNGVLTGAVRTTGWSSSVSKYYTYATGGDISIMAGGDITGGVDVYAWDSGYGKNQRQYWGAAYETDASNTTLPTLGIAAMGGGDVDVRVRGDFTTQAGTFGNKDAGNLNINAGGDINGRFLVRQGECNLNALGNFGVDLTGRLDNQTIEAFDTRVNLWAAGDARLGSVVNPTIDRPGFARSFSATSGSMTLTYTEDASVAITALSGDVTLTGKAGPYRKRKDYSLANSNILPATLEIAAGRDIVLGYTSLYLTPSPTGNLALKAGRDITAMYTENGLPRSGSIIMSDCDPAKVYGVADQAPVKTFAYLSTTSDTDVIHRWSDTSGTEDADRKAAAISAGRDITNLKLYLPKSVAITAGDDIRDIYVQSNNLMNGDVSLVQAGNDIVLSSVDVDANADSGIKVGGPGTLIVQAGRDLDFGNTQGVLSVANQFNTLSETGSDLIVAAGVENTLTPATVTDLFAALKAAGMAYTALKDSDPAAAAAIVADINDNHIAPLLGSVKKDTGRILMTRSQIKTYGKDNDINIMASGSINVGRSAIASSGATEISESGITTDFGGAINTLTLGDVNVLESRMMTLFGGDILVWSAYGDINAGRGSKTQINRQRPTRYYDKTTGTYKYKNQAVAVGSGIRTLTYDPDGAGPEDAPAAGDAYIFAPSGYIDAGEAGIGAVNLYLGAEEVRNTQNIEVGGLSVGVPMASVNTAAIGALTGSSALAGSSAISESMSAVSTTTGAKTAGADEQAYVPKWIKVMVVGFDEDDPTGPAGDKSKDKEKKEQK